MSEKLIIQHCAPTLAGLKTGNLFTYRFETTDALREDIRTMNRKLAKKGLRILPLRMEENSALIYVYRPSRLKRDFSCEDAVSILEQYGYVCAMPDRCVVHLIKRLREKEEFPHEIGLFLGYPPEDVKGFIEHGAKCSKYVGYWKVYGDEEKAKKLFAQYKKCTDSYIHQLEKGHTIERLTVAI